MDDVSRRPMATPPYAVAQSVPHRLLACEACKCLGRACEPGHFLRKKLHAVISAAGLGEEFEVSGPACLAGCDRACTVASWPGGKATWFFGDIVEVLPVDDLIEFSHLHARFEDGWCGSADCLPRLRENTLARVPAAIIVTHEGPLA